MKSSIIAVALTLGGIAALSAPMTAAEAAPRRANVTVTISAQGTDMSGVVRSPRPLKCAANRTVKLFKMVNGQPHLFTTDTTSLQGGKWVWSSGNTGQEGRFFAKVARKPGCKADVSRTIQVRRNP